MSAMSRRTALRTTALISGAAVASLTGCAPEEQSTRSTPVEQPTASASVKSSKTLLVYFSRAGENYFNGGRRVLQAGNTKVVAGMISELVDCDVYEIQAAEPYSDSYDETVQRNRLEQSDDARPAIAGALPDISKYDTVILGSPVWNVAAPMIISTFLEKVDLAGKTVLPFVTYAVSGLAGIDEDYRAKLPSSTVLNGLAVRGEEVEQASAELTSWLRQHQLIK